MNTVTLDIDLVTVETEAERVQLEEATREIQEAFHILARLLERTPFHQFGDARRHFLEQLRVSALPLDELVSPRGAERLADEMYRQIVRGLR